MKYPASFFTRTRLPVRRAPTSAPPEPPPNLGPRPPTEKELQEAPVARKYEPLDSWEPRYRMKEELPPSPPIAQPKFNAPPQQTVPVPQAEEGPEITSTAREMKNQKKVRTSTMGVSVSREERDLLRRHAAGMGMTFSEWARSVLFRAMGRKIPARPKRDWED